MMKCMFALVLLLHFCYSVNFNLNSEMIARLDKLNELYRKKELQITSPDAVRAPSAGMDRNAAFCVDVFNHELGLLLANVSVHHKNEYILTELQALREKLRPRLPQTDRQCKMLPNTRSVTPFKPYSRFLRKLNGRI
ncbi:uncharacterized protein ACBT44_007300 [Syngnathus typhle]